MRCVVRGCARNRRIHKDASFYSIPKVRKDETKLLAKRRALWLKRVNITEEQLKTSGRVCNKHFILGKPSYERDISNPDWAPTLLLEHKEQASANRFQRRYNRSQAIALLDIPANGTRKGTNVYKEPKRQTAMEILHPNNDPNKILESISKLDSIVSLNSSCVSRDSPSLADNSCVELLDITISNESSGELLQSSSLQATPLSDSNNASLDSIWISRDSSVMAEHSYVELLDINNSNESNGDLLQRNIELEKRLQVANSRIHELNSALEAMNVENCNLVSDLTAKSKDLYSLCMEKEDLMVYYACFTRNAFESMFKALLPIKENNNSSLDLRRQLFITLLKLSHNFGLGDLAVQFSISRFTASAYFHKWISIVHDRLFSKVIIWPSKQTLQKTMPMCFRVGEFVNTTAIWDCFEIETDTPHTPVDQVGSSSHCKQRSTDKILISVTPQGTVSFVSNGFCGRMSDKQVVLESGILEKINREDLILADRGFPLDEAVACRGAKFEIPPFMKDRKQLSENETRIANWRIHVERVIGSIRGRFKILKGPIKTSYLKTIDDKKSFVDKIVKVCCIFNNLLPSVVPLD